MASPTKAHPTNKSGHPSLDGKLTARQIQVAELIAEDLTAKQIADRLGLSTKTVIFHRQAIKKRLKVRGTAGIIRYAIREGIIEA